MLQAFYSASILFVLLLFLAHRRVKASYVLTAVLLSLAFILLISIALFRDVQRTILSDFFEFYKPVFGALIFLTTFLIRWDDEAVGKVVKAYLIVVTFTAVYSLFEALGGPVADNVAVVLYKSGKDVLVGKATGSFGGTYTLASFMLFGVAFSGALFLYLKKARYGLLAALSLAAVFLSQSRAGVIGLVAMCVSVCMFYWKYQNFRNKPGFYLAAGSVLLTLLLFHTLILSALQNLPYLYSGLSRLLEQGVDAETAGSFGERYRQMLFVIESQDAIPLVGVGIGKGYARLLESYYALYLYRFGAIGIVISLVLFVSFFYLGIKCFNLAVRNGRPENACLFLALHLWMYAFPVLSLATAMHDQVKFAVFFYGGLGIMTSYNALRGQAGPTGELVR